MDYRKIGKTDIEVSALSLGAFGMGGGTAWIGCDDAESVKIIHQAYDQGINLVDSAPVYGAGHSEIVVGKAVQGRRSDFILETKCSLQWRDQRGMKEYDRDGNAVYRSFAPDSIRQDLEDSLQRMGTDYIDIYVVHRQPGALEDVGEIYQTLADLKQAGKIRAIGLSNTNATYLAEFLKHGPIDLVQEQFNILEQGAAQSYIPLCEQEQVTFQCFSALERGLLTGKFGMDFVLTPGEARGSSPWFAPEKRKIALDMMDKWAPICAKHDCSITNVALAYTMGISPVFNTLVGVRRMENLADSIKAANLVLDLEDLAILDAATQQAHRLASMV